MAINVFTFSGNLGQDAETRFTPDGKPVVSFSVASTAGYGDKQKTTWIRCNAWGERYQKIAEYLKKGKKVTVSGEFSQREWQDNSGATKYSCEVRVNDLDLPPRSDQDGAGQAYQQAPQQQSDHGQQRSQNTGSGGPTPAMQQDYGSFDDDIPF